MSDEAVPGMQGDGKDAAVVNIGSNSAASAPPAAGMAAIAARAANAPAKTATPAKLREALAEYFSGRYGRSHKAAQRAVAIQDERQVVGDDHEFRTLAHLLVEKEAGRLDRPAGQARER